MATNTARYLELDSTVGDKGPLSKAMHSSWVKASTCGLTKTRYSVCGNIIRGVADTSTENQGVRVQILAWSSTRGQIWTVKNLKLRFN